MDRFGVCQEEREPTRIRAVMDHADGLGEDELWTESVKKKQMQKRE